MNVCILRMNSYGIGGTSQANNMWNHVQLYLCLWSDGGCFLGLVDSKRSTVANYLCFSFNPATWSLVVSFASFFKMKMFV